MDSDAKVVIVIGGVGLLGKQFVKALYDSNNIVVIADYNVGAAESFKKELVDSGCTAANLSAHFVDITAKESILSLINYVSSNYGKINGVVNTAYPRNARYGRKFEKVEFSDFCENTNLNLGGYFLVAQQFAEYFSSHNGGDIINIASIYGVIAPKFEVYEDTTMTTPVEYAAIKSALIHLGKYIAKYYRGKKVRINTISPGGILDGQNELFLSKYNANCNSKGMLAPKQIADVVVFMLSDQSAGISGQNIIVDDGFIL